MIVLNKKQWATGMALVLGTVMQMSAADFVWTGNAGNGDWSSGANWLGGIAPSGSGHTLTFSGTNGLISDNNLLAQVNGILFREGAGAFTIGQNALTLGGSIINESSNAQTFNVGLALSGHRTFDTRHGDIILAGPVSASGSSFRIDKHGRETLELRGANTYAGRNHLYRGTFALNASSGTLSSTDIYFGDPTNIIQPNNATFALKGANYSYGGTVAVVGHAGYTLRAEGVALTLNNYTHGISFFGTVNFDLSQAGSSVAITNAPTLSNGLLHSTTVTDGVKTGFATMSGGNVVRQNSASLAALPASGSSATTNYRAAGDTVMTAAQSIHTLTINGAGTLSGAAHALTFREMLMEEGTGDYRISVGRIGHNSNLVFHQYSQSGNLIVDSQILLTVATNSVTKTGPGTMIVTENSISAYSGATRIHSGRFELDGELTRTNSVTVFDDGTLAGGGEIGATAPSDVEIRGGRLEATSSRALTINGALRFTQESEFSMLLDGVGNQFVDVNGSITIGSNINLDLVLGHAPTPDWEYILLQGDSITGSFATVNGFELGSDGRFELVYNSNNYTFEIFGDSEMIGIRAIPEPSLYALLGVGVAFTLLRRRRASAHQVL